VHFFYFRVYFVYDNIINIYIAQIYRSAVALSRLDSINDVTSDSETSSHLLND